MKRLMLFMCLLAGSNAAFVQFARAVPPTQNESRKCGLGDTVYATILFVAGAWLAHNQLPRLAGQKIEFDAPVFTKVGASLLFGIGMVGGLVGAYNL